MNGIDFKGSFDGQFKIMSQHLPSASKESAKTLNVAGVMTWI
jgi:hypothetical protein